MYFYLFYIYFLDTNQTQLIALSSLPSCLSMGGIHAFSKQIYGTLAAAGRNEFIQHVESITLFAKLSFIDEINLNLNCFSSWH
jgi:hypothetical protein